MKTIHTLFSSLLCLTLAVASTGCDAPDESTGELTPSELFDLDVQAQLEAHTQAELVCSAYDEVSDDAIAELEPCTEWTEVADELPVESAEQDIPAGACNVWQETSYVGTNINCGGWGGGPCSGKYCCTYDMVYVRTCSACPPSVPTSCGGWTYTGLQCGCG